MTKTFPICGGRSYLELPLEDIDATYQLIVIKRVLASFFFTCSDHQRKRILKRSRGIRPNELLLLRNLVVHELAHDFFGLRKLPEAWKSKLRV